MFKSTPQRNSRCKDFKVKRALQICVLLGVCIWMVYLTQHSRAKRTSYSEGTKTDTEVGKLGRKDLHPNADQSSIVNAGRKEKEDEEKNKREEQNKTDNVNGVEDEILEPRNAQNNNEDTKESVVNNQESKTNKHKTNKEGEDNKTKLDDNQSREISKEKSETEKEGAVEIETSNKEDEENDQNRNETKEDMEGNHTQEEKDENNVAENEREENDEIHESSKDQVNNDQDNERNNEEAIEEHVASNLVDLNKTEQSDKGENNEFELESQTNGTQVTNFTVKTNNQREGSENEIEKKNDSQKSSITESGEQNLKHNKSSSDDVETLHSQNATNTTSNIVEKLFETSENSKVKDSILHNTTLEMKDSKSDVVAEQINSTLTNSSRVQENNVTNGGYNGEEKVNDNGHDALVSASDFSVLEEKDASSKNNVDAKQVENENITTSENEDGAQNEQVEMQKDKGGVEVEH